MASGAPRLEKRDLTVAVVPAVDSAGFYIALQKGLFAAQGLHIKYVPAVSSETVIPGQEAGQYDITGGNYVSYVQAEVSNPAAGLEIIAAGSTMQTGSQAVYVMPGSGITGISQLEGKTIAINAPDGIEFLLAASVLAEYQIPLASVNWAYVPFPNMANALTSGQDQAAEMPQPFATQDSDTLGLVELVDTDQGATQDLPIQGYVATRAWVRQNPGTLAAFTRALEQGQEIADTSPTAVAQAIEKFDGANAVTAGSMPLSEYPLSINEVQLQRIPDLMQLYGLLHRQFSISSMLGS